MRRAAALLVLLALVAAGLALLRRERREPPLPRELSGTLVYVSDRTGSDTLYARRLPSGQERRLTYFSEPVHNPALSPDGARVAFDVGGRLALVELSSGAVQVLTFGVDFRDAMPAWRPDGQALACSSRRPGEAAADIHAITPLDATGAKTVRIFVTQTKGLDETEPTFSPDGSFVVFVREDSLYRVELSGGRTRRLTGGFRKTRAPRFLPDGRLLCLWREEKSFGADVLDAELKTRTTLWMGSTYYRSLAPSPDGRYFAATYTFDLSFHPLDALRPRQVEELRLLDARGALIAPLAASLRFSNHSPQWAR
jgi:Tol biopolymer transport system component